MGTNNNNNHINGSRPPGANLGLTRQPSIYSLTFDELQTTMGGIGKDFGSMNMDELLKNIWSAEETQLYSATTAEATISGVAVNEGNNLQRQGSLTLPRTLSQKTVDEVWKDISKEYSIVKDVVGGSNSGKMNQSQQTLGEVTLEEFLVRAGVVREDAQIGGGVGGVNLGKASGSNGGIFADFARGVGNTGFGIGYPQMGRGGNASHNQNLAMSVNGVRADLQQTQQQPPQQPHQQQPPQQKQIYPKQPAMGFAGQLPMQGGAQLGTPGIHGGIMGINDQGLSSGLVQSGGMGMVGLGAAGAVTVATGSPASQLSPNGISKSNGDTSSVSPVPYVFNGGMRGRKMNGAVEKVVERRQRRMIKNRESAARSRARKQAYTMELEQEVAKLKEENQELRKKQEELMEMQKNQVLEMMSMQQGSKKLCLRRTQTGPW